MAFERPSSHGEVAAKAKQAMVAAIARSSLSVETEETVHHLPAVESGGRMIEQRRIWRGACFCGHAF